jgi:hypothetical protein
MVVPARAPGRGQSLSESGHRDHRFRAAGMGTGRLVDIAAGIWNPCRHLSINELARV